MVSPAYIQALKAAAAIPGPFRLCVSLLGIMQQHSHMRDVQVLPGEYIEAGRQGSPRLGEVKPPTDLPPNNELLDSQSFRWACSFLQTTCCSDSAVPPSGPHQYLWHDLKRPQARAWRIRMCGVRIPECSNA